MKFYIYTLGCKVNTYESSVMSELLKKKGLIEIEDNKEENVADVYIINTCAVTNTATHKSLKMVRQAIRKNKNAIVAVVGCLTQKEADNVSKIDGVSIILGNKNKSKIYDYIEEYQKNKKQIVDIYNLDETKFEDMKLENTNKTRAFVKIQDGCNNFCHFCIIPYTRGNVRSKEKEKVLEEITQLVSNGHKEIVLTGIHTGHYGQDLKNYDLADLLSEIVKINRLERIRISSIEITEITDKVLNVIKNNDKIVSHLHIPLQSGCDKTLKEMNRKYDVKYFIDKIEKIRKIRPDISITTDVIVGFPNETEEDFKTTIENIKKINFSKLHVFPYSVRKGTVAEKMDNQISEEIKKQRVNILIDLSKELEIKYMEKFINKEVVLIPEISHDEYLIGHTGNYLSVKVKANKKLLHEDVLVKITKIEYPHCIAELEK